MRTEKEIRLVAEVLKSVPKDQNSTWHIAYRIALEWVLEEAEDK